jgi:hypothetical protein
MKKRSIVPGGIEGFLSGCPFCTSRRKGIPTVGTRFRLISGYHVGDTGSVVNWPSTIEPIENEFIAQMDGEPPHVQSRINIRGTMIEELPSQPVPRWAPPLSMDDASKLDEAVQYFCEKSFQINKWQTDWNAFNEIIRVIWYYKLPIDGTTLWRVLEAHGVPQQSKKKTIEFYEKGSKLVLYCTDKKIRKKKKIEPLTE